MATGRIPDPNSAPITAKGDLYTYSTVPARLAVGNNGETLVADSSATTGLRWQGSTPAGKNALINGNFDIWQRGTSFVAPANNSYTADRWGIFSTAATTTFSQETSVVPSGSRYAIKASQATNSSGVYVIQAIETMNSLQFANKRVTVSAQVAASTSTVVSILMYYSTSVDNALAGSWTQITATSGGSATPTSTTYVPISGVYDIPSTAKTIMVQYTATVTAGNSIYVGQAQLELGSVATTFSRAAGTLAGELAACQRYYARFTVNGAYGNFPILNSAWATTNTSGTAQLPVTMRVAPTSIDYTALWITDFVNNFTPSALTISTATGGLNQAEINITTTGLTQYRLYRLQANNNANAYLGFNAEL